MVVLDMEDGGLPVGPVDFRCRFEELAVPWVDRLEPRAGGPHLVRVQVCLSQPY